MAFNDNIKVYTSNALSSIQAENSIKFNEMVECLNAFHTNQSNAIDEESISKYPLLTKSIYDNLERLLMEIAYSSTTQEERIDKIDEVYDWFINSKDEIPRLNKMTYKTYDCLLDGGTFLTANIEQDGMAYNESNLHRSNDLDELNPNGRIDSVFRRHCHKVNIINSNNTKELGMNGLGNNDSMILDNSRGFKSMYLSSRPLNKFGSISQRQPRMKYYFNLSTIKEKEDNKYENIKRSGWYLQQQHDLLAERQRLMKNKRYTEEVKTILNEFGIIKAKFNETQIKKSDIKKIIEQYSIKRYQKLNPINDDNKSKPKDYNKCSNDFERNTISKSNKISMSKAHIKASLSNSLSNKRMKSMDVKVKKMNINRVTPQFFNFTHNQKNLRSDMVPIGMTNNAIFNTRIINKSLLNVREIPQEKDEESHTIPISAYHLANHRYDDNDSINKSNGEFIRSSTDFVKKEFTRSSSFLELRKTMETFKKYELSSLRAKLKKNKRKVDPKSLSVLILHPKTCEINPISYLPKAGSGLLSNQSFNVTANPKKKKKAKPKK